MNPWITESENTWITLLNAKLVLMERFRSGIFLSLFVILLFSCNRKDETDRKEDAGTPIDTYVVMVSFDGFRWDYLDLYHTPNFDAMASEGVRAEKMIPSFPTKTFPNHFTIATGLYPDHHGVINNSFYADELNGVYQMGDRSMVENPAAYNGEPIWLTAEKQGLKSACYYWVGSEAPIGGDHPTYWRKYKESVPYLKRVDQVIDWLELPLNKRPALVTLYFDEPDGIAHDMGPEHPKTGEVIETLDNILGELRFRISELDIADRVNLIVLSDHGMGPTSGQKYVNIMEFIEEEWIDQVIGGNPVYLIDPADGFEDSVSLSLDVLEGVSAWQKEDVPTRLNYGTNPRFPGIVVVADSLWSIGTKANLSGYSRGAHGYDNAFSDMHTIFLGEGPAFRKDFVVRPFSNVEVYGIVAHILGLTPAQTDGKLSNVSDLFSEK